MKFNVKLHNLNFITLNYIKFNVLVTEKYICVHVRKFNVYFIKPYEMYFS